MKQTKAPLRITSKQARQDPSHRIPRRGERLAGAARAAVSRGNGFSPRPMMTAAQTHSGRLADAPPPAMAALDAASPPAAACAALTLVLDLVRWPPRGGLVDAPSSHTRWGLDSREARACAGFHFGEEL